MRLEMKYFDVMRARFGAKTGFADGVLTIDKDELIGLLSGDPRIGSSISRSRIPAIGFGSPTRWKSSNRV